MLAGVVFEVALLALGPVDLERWRPAELQVVHRAPASFSELKERALSYLGRPYAMGGVGDPGFDCSGFTCRIFAESGYALPRVSRDQALAGQPVPLDAVRPGDLLFFAADRELGRITHVGLALGNGEMVHAASGLGRVAVSSFVSGWYASHLVKARRILSNEGGAVLTSSTSSVTPPALELAEHAGADELPPTLRLPLERAPAVVLGPELPAREGSALAVRALALTERGILGLVISPELSLRFDSLALGFELAVPIRVTVGDGAVVGAVQRFADLFRFLREVSFGLRGAELELRLSRFGDQSLGERLVVDRLAPASRTEGVPGFTVARSPLSFFGAVRRDGFAVEAMVDDAIDPSLVAVGLKAPLGSLVDGLAVSVALASDQRAQGIDGGRRALDAAELSLSYLALESREWTAEVFGGGGAIRQSAIDGGGASAGLFVERRFGASGGASLSARAEGSLLGRGYLAGVLGPTYVVFGEAHAAALAEAGTRAAAYGELLLRLDRLLLGVGYGDGWGAGRVALDQRWMGLVELRGIALGGSQLLDVRVAYTARGPLGSTDVLHAGARLRLKSWSFLELYLEKGQRLEGGGGITVAWLF